ncbi:MAG: hypothetical protein J6R17_00460, partial [Bacteroidales bacterium]|nr:hypothetical protein [Bacteroidales bacterium]
NREVKPRSADDTASTCGKVGRRHPITEASACSWGFSVFIYIREYDKSLAEAQSAAEERCLRVSLVSARILNILSFLNTLRFLNPPMKPQIAQIAQMAQISQISQIVRIAQIFVTEKYSYAI